MTVWRRTGQTAGIWLRCGLLGLVTKADRRGELHRQGKNIGGTWSWCIAVTGTVDPTNAESRLREGSTSDNGLAMSGDALPRLLRALRSWYQMIVDHQRDSGAGISDGDSCYYEFLAALAQGYRWDLGESQLRPFLKKNWNVFDETGSNVLAAKVTQDKLAMKNLGDLMLRITGRKLCIAVDETLLICPPLTEMGDQVVLFRGVRAPFIVRVKGPQPRYQLIGPCYLHRPICRDTAWAYLENEQELQEFFLG